jgi:CTP synthase
VEVADHPWFVACQFHPEFASTPFRPSPLFVDFIAAARKRAVKRESFEETDG